MSAYTASCLCGGVKFRITGKLAPIQVCHCSQCRRAQGTPFATNVPVVRSAFQLDSGAELLSEYESSPGKRRAFCSRCGSPIYSRRDEMPDTLRIRAGLIHEALPVRPVAHFCTASKA
ncbi:MAG TPA: GFA family protein, partial [Rhizobacter sp.]|nr:GFA family protein [Rhizobacter sp.]